MNKCENHDFGYSVTEHGTIEHPSGPQICFKCHKTFGEIEKEWKLTLEQILVELKGNERRQDIIKFIQRKLKGI